MGPLPDSWLAACMADLTPDLQVCLDHFTKMILTILLPNFEQVNLTVLELNDMSTLVDHFMLSPREREKRKEIIEAMKERDRVERGK